MNEKKFNPIDLKNITTPEVTKESGVLEMNFPTPKPKVENNALEMNSPNPVPKPNGNVLEMNFRKADREKKKEEDIAKIMEKLKDSYAA